MTLRELAKVLVFSGACVGVVALTILSTAHYLVGQADLFYLTMAFYAGVLIGLASLTLIAAGGLVGVFIALTGAAKALFKGKD